MGNVKEKKRKGKYARVLFDTDADTIAETKDNRLNVGYAIGMPPRYRS